MIGRGRKTERGGGEEERRGGGVGKGGEGGRGEMVLWFKAV